MKKIPNWWLYLPILILAINLIVRLIDQSQLLHYFPLDYTNDIASYMAQLFFLDKCGFHQFCSYWYNGFLAFEFTPPAWFFFTWPLLKIFGDVKVATYISMILIFVLGFVAFIFLGKLFRFSLTKRIAFFLLFFGNAIAIGNFIRLGDVHQLFGWLNLVIVSFIALYYKDKNLDWKFYWIIPFLALVILSHQTVAILMPFVLLGLFLKKRKKEKIKIILSGLISLIITSFWWIPYIRGFSKTIGPQHILTKSLISLNKLDLPQNIAAFIVPLIFGIIFYYYWESQKKDKKELLFFAPIIFLSMILFFRIIYFIPGLKQVYPDAYMYLLIFFSIFMFLKLDINFLKLKKFIPLVLILISLISVSFNVFYTPEFIVPNETGDKILNMLEKVEGKFYLRLEEEGLIYSKAVYSYAPIYLNLSTSEGFYFVFDEEHLKNSNELREGFREEDCHKIRTRLKTIQTEEIVAVGRECEILKKCDFEKKEETENVCLYYVD